MPTNLVKRGDVYYCRVQVHGTRHWKSTGFHDLERARRAAREIENSLRAGDLGWGTTAPTVAEWWDTYRQAYTPRKRAPHRDAQLLAAFVARYGTTRLDAIKTSDCERWIVERGRAISERTRRVLAPGTVEREHSFLKGFFQKAIKDGKLDENPWKGVTPPKGTPRTRVLTFEEEAKLRMTLRPDYQRLLTVILGTGMREGELLGLRPKDLTATHVWVTGKFGKSRKIPLRRDVRQALEEQRGPQGYWTQDGRVLRAVLRDACRRARVPHTTIHDLRRTFASRCAGANMPPKMLQDILGHASMEITMKHYVHVDERAAITLLETMPLMPGQKVVALKARQS